MKSTSYYDSYIVFLRKKNNSILEAGTFKSLSSAREFAKQNKHRFKGPLEIWHEEKVVTTEINTYKIDLISSRSKKKLAQKVK